MPLDRRMLTYPRPVLAFLLSMFAWATFPPAHATQNAVPRQPEEFASAARRAVAHGQRREAEAMARQRGASDAAAAAVLGQLAADRGRYEEAIGLLRPAAAREPSSEAAFELALVYGRTGRTDEARRLLTGVLDAGTGGDADARFRAARAAHALGRAREANALYRAAAAAANDPAIQTAWGMLFLEKYNKPEAHKSLQAAIAADAQWAPAHAALARVLADENPPAATAAANRALEIDADLADAHLLLAELALNESRYDDARTRIDTVLRLNPSHLEAHAWTAAIAYVRDEPEAFDAAVQRVLAINARYSDVYRVAADLAARNYRFEEAVALTRRALALDPENSRASGDLGLHLMRTGDEAEARRALEGSFKADPFDVVTFNLLTLLDSLDKFVVESSGDLVFKFHPDEAPILREYAIPLAHEALKSLADRYQVTPRGPILIEVFPTHDDFAVRTLGLPGMIGALGACFGRVVTMDSPRAKAPGTFSWQATLWHELAHVVTLQLSNQRVPRWLTEGISVFEEAKARPEWGRDMEVPFATALQRKQILAVKDLNSGFTKPETIGLAYYESSLLVEHIVEKFGQEALRTLVATYGQGVDGGAALEKGLGVTTESLQESFDAALQARFANLMAALRERPDDGLDGGRGGGGLAALKAAAAAYPDSYQAQLALGRALADAGVPAAFEPLERARALVPMATGETSPHAIMAGLAEKLGDLPRAIRAYRGWLTHDHAVVEPARRLVTLAQKAGDREAELAAFGRIVEIDPFDAQAHVGLGRAALQAQDPALAAREFRAALAAGVQDKASAHTSLGEAYLRSGRTTEAKKQALLALEIAPAFEQAQDLLLRTVDPR